MTDLNRTAHLVGSIPLSSSEEVFCTICDAFGSHLKRLPDGETGERGSWILYQREMLLQHPAMEADTSIPKFAFKQWDGKVIREVELLKIRDDVDTSTLEFPVGYAVHAIESFKDFQRLQAEGKIPQNVRFQVSLPTPMATGYNYVSPNGRQTFLEVYERSFAKDVAKILDNIPHDKLAIQWDVCQEVLVFEDYYLGRPDDYERQIFDQFARLASWIPEPVELGFHICYGSPGNDHVIRPQDFALSVKIANGIAEGVNRKLEFMHMPGTFGEPEASFFEPLRDLRLPAECELYLGLLFDDEEEGNEARIEMARNYVADFGIATVCGWGRANADSLPSLLRCHQVALGDSA